MQTPTKFISAGERGRKSSFPSSPWYVFLLLTLLVSPWRPAASQSSQSITVRPASAPRQRVPRQKPAFSALQGRVLDRDGIPVPGLVVSLDPARTACAHPSPLCSLTDADGIFRLVGVTPQTYPFAVYLRSQPIFRKAAVVVGPSQIVTVQIRLGFAMPPGPASVIPFHPEAVTASSYHELSRHGINDGTLIPPIQASPSDRELYKEMPDRWKLPTPNYRRYAGDPQSQFVLGHWWDPFNRNMLKGDYPINGRQTFFTFTGDSITALDSRRLPTPSSNYPARPGEENFFGRPQQFFLAQTFRLRFQLSHGDTSFRPVDWQIRFTPVANINFLQTQENGIVNINPAYGTDRLDGWVGVQELFFEKKLRDLSPNYDFVSLRAGIQQFSSDFRGFIFADEQPGLRIFGNWRSNRFQYNLAAFDLLEKNTNSELNTFHRRFRQVGVANVYIEDFLFKGYTTEFSFDVSNDEATVHYDDNGFPVRPAIIGSAQPHSIRSYYLGWTSDGHIGRIDVDHAFYQALGHDSLNPITGKRADINAQLAALELSRDQDWMRYRVSFLYASGDAHPHDAKSRIARGFDSIVDNESFAGGEFSFFNRESIRLTSTGVALNSPDSFLPDLVSEKNEGQSNFVNPGLGLVNAGADARLTQKVKLVSNVSYLRFMRTEPLEYLLFQAPIQHSIGVDSSLGVIWRPLLSDNIVVKAGFADLVPGKGLREINQSKVLLSAFGTVRFQF